MSADLAPQTDEIFNLCPNLQIFRVFVIQEVDKKGAIKLLEAITLTCRWRFVNVVTLCNKFRKSSFCSEVSSKYNFHSYLYFQSSSEVGNELFYFIESRDCLKVAKMFWQRGSRNGPYFYQVKKRPKLWVQRAQFVLPLSKLLSTVNTRNRKW